MKPFKHCMACLAASVDGKITAPHSEADWVKLGTQNDLNRLFTLRDGADVICFGANTLRAWPAVRRGLKHREHPKAPPPIHVIFTRSWQLPFASPCFQERLQHPDWPPLFVASPQLPPEQLHSTLSQLRVEAIHLDAATPPARQLTQVAETLAPYQPETWLCEGGGELLSFFLAARAVDELHLTMTPQLIGGQATPGLVGGFGFGPDEWPTVAWEKIEHAPPEIFLTGRVQYS